MPVKGAALDLSANHARHRVLAERPGRAREIYPGNPVLELRLIDRFAQHLLCRYDRERLRRIAEVRHDAYDPVLVVQRLDAAEYGPKRPRVALAGGNRHRTTLRGMGGEHDGPRPADRAEQLLILGPVPSPDELDVVRDQLWTVPAQLIEDTRVKRPGQRRRAYPQRRQRPVVQCDDHDVAWWVLASPNSETRVDRVELEGAERIGCP